MRLAGQKREGKAYGQVKPGTQLRCTVYVFVCYHNNSLVKCAKGLGSRETTSESVSAVSDRGFVQIFNKEYKYNISSYLRQHKQRCAARI